MQNPHLDIGFTVIDNKEVYLPWKMGLNFYEFSVKPCTAVLAKLKLQGLTTGAL